MNALTSHIVDFRQVVEEQDDAMRLPGGAWHCVRCTFVNFAQAGRCGACVLEGCARGVARGGGGRCDGTIVMIRRALKLGKSKSAAALS